MASESSAHPLASKAPPRRLLWQMLPVDWGRVQEVTNEPVPGHIKRWWFALGGTPAYLFLIQLTTGILLSFYYVPSPDRAYESVTAITHQIPFGWFIRSIHKWSANLMIITVLLHMCRVYFSCAFRHPRQMNWVIGCGLLGCTFVLGFTGYSLVYEQLSYWGMTVATQLMEVAPFVGHTVANFMRGGESVNPNTLTRMFNLHVGILPVIMVLLIGLHVTMLRLHGVSELSFSAPADRGRRGAVGPGWGARLIALLAAMAAVLCVAMAAINPAPVNLIAHELSLESSRVFWAFSSLVCATASVLLFRGHMHGLMIWLLVATLALGKLVFDLVNGEARYAPAWMIASALLGVTIVYGVVRHRRFDEGPAEEKPFSFFPDHLITEVMIGTLLLFLLTLLSLVFPAELGPKANPLQTPEHIKPEWYFYFQFRMLKLMGLTSAVFLTGALAVLMVLWPLVDALLEKIAPRKDLGVYIGIVAFCGFLVLTVWESMA